MGTFLASSAWSWGRHLALHVPLTQWLSACPQSQWHNHPGPGTRTLWEGYTEWAAGPPSSLFAPELHLHSGPSLPELLVHVSALAVHLADPDLDLFPGCAWTYPIPMNPQSDLDWGWPCSALLAGVPWDCILCVWGYCHSGHTVTHTHSSPLLLVHLAQLFPDVLFPNSYNRCHRSKLHLLKACPCLCSPLPYL